jgi:hypothetical protein
MEQKRREDGMKDHACKQKRSEKGVFRVLIFTCNYFIL